MRYSWALLLSCLALCATATARPLDDVVDSGKLVVFVYSDYAPYSWEQDGTLQGIDVAIGRAFGESLGVEVEFLVRGADENVDDDLRVNIWKGDLIERRAADVMLHVPYDRELDTRNELAVLGSPYFQERMAVLVNAERIDKLETFGRFVNSPISVELDTAADFFLSGAFNGQLQQSVRRGRTFDTAANTFLAGDTDALMASRAQVEWVATRAVKFPVRITQPPMPGIVRTGWPIGLAVKHDSRDLGYALGDVISELIDSGRMSEICQHYGVSYQSPELL